MAVSARGAFSAVITILATLVFGLALLLGQVAVPVVLLVFGGSFLRVPTRLTSIDLGFASDHIALLSVDLSMQGYTPERGRAFVDEALTRLRDVPGVTAVDMAARVMLLEVHRLARPH